MRRKNVQPTKKIIVSGAANINVGNIKALKGQLLNDKVISRDKLKEHEHQCGSFIERLHEGNRVITEVAMYKYHASLNH